METEKLPELETVVIAKCKRGDGSIEEHKIRRIASQDTVLGWHWSHATIHTCFTLEVVSWENLPESTLSMKSMKATKRLIDAVWTVEYEKISEKKVKIINYSRTDPEGYEKEKQLPQCHLVETEGRIVTHLLLKPYKAYDLWVSEKNATEIYEVENPKFIFSYEQEK
ncbi:hypothetical protein [Chryseobacterium candidae]|uniref:Uncharacterized protein n=1 Tax=Chryseobacterium candidae TaxID=1978493 RepID=A0ABY2R877_9FLAO|nr:hypothetical protein [Chryseobacterium candidae]THV60740.1 hypothetical protein EK417_09140 [Chryseobacterium candidae]